MKIPNYIKNKMHRLAKLKAMASDISGEIDIWFEDQGFDVDKLRCGNGVSLEELDYGNDLTDEICGWIEENEDELKLDV